MWRAARQERRPIKSSNEVTTTIHFRLSRVSRGADCLELSVSSRSAAAERKRKRENEREREHNRKRKNKR